MTDGPAAVESFAALVDRATALADRSTSLVDRATSLVDRAIAPSDRSPAVLGIVGPPGAGKTTLALAVAAAVGERLGPQTVRHVPMDGFHLADVELDRLGRRNRKGAPDTFDPAGFAALLARIREGGPDTVYAPAFDRDLEQPVAGSIPIEAGTMLVVTEGLYLLRDGPWAAVRALLDESWYVQLAGDRRTGRLVGRHERFGKAHDAAVEWVARVDGGNAAQVERTRDTADLLVPGDLRLEGFARATDPAGR